jgi:hypothetical protein
VHTDVTVVDLARADLSGQDIETRRTTRKPL